MYKWIRRSPITDLIQLWGLLKQYEGAVIQAIREFLLFLLRGLTIAYESRLAFMLSNGIHSLRITNEDCVFMVPEGRQAEFVGEKAPLDDARETHGICLLHRDQIREHWQASTRYTHEQAFLRAATTFTLFRWPGLLISQKNTGVSRPFCSCLTAGVSCCDRGEADCR